MRKVRLYLSVLLLLFCFFLTACSSGADRKYGLDAKKSQIITIWHYYNGQQAVAFDTLVSEFNNTIGAEKGIMVYAESKASINELQSALLASAQKEAGAEELPNLFLCYSDMAAELDEIGILVNLDEYVSQELKEKYVEAYVDEGYVNGSWKLFPVAKSTEVLMLNKTDWDIFSEASGYTYEDLTTWESITEVSEHYYEWSGGKSFFGRDAFANYMIVGSYQLGHEIFHVDNGKMTLELDKDTMHRLWDNFYVPYVKGYFKHVGRYRSDDIKLGEIVAQVCANTSASYFPEEVVKEDGSSYPIDYAVLPLPGFEGTSPCAVQQGANMAVAKATAREEYASVVFMEWFTEKERNMGFSVESSYLPVMKEANSLAAFEAYKEEKKLAQTVDIETIEVAIKQMAEYQTYTTVAFSNAADARSILSFSMLDLAVADREQIIAKLESGKVEEDVLPKYLSEEHFEQWYTQLKDELTQYE